MGILRRLREWREDANGILTGPAIDTDTLDANSVNTEQTLIGTGYQNPKPENGTAGIQAAIDALPSGGGVVHLQAGRYEVNNVDDPYKEFPVNITKNNVAIIGEGWQSEIFLPDGSASASTSGGENKGSRIIHDGEDGTVSDPNYYDGTILMNFAVNGNQQNNGGVGDGERITDLNDGHNIQLNGRYNIIHGVKSYNSTGDGMEFISWEDPSTCRYNIVSNCVFHNNYEQDMHNHGAWDTIWTHNLCIDEVQNSAVMLQSDNTDNRNIYIYNNRIRGSGQHGAYLSNQAPGFTAENIWFVGNSIKGCTRHGIEIEAGGDGIHVLNNDIQDNTLDGIELVNASDVTIKNNYIAGNGDQGIYGEGCSLIDVSNNWIEFNDDHGIEFAQSSSGQVIENIEIVDNRIYNNNRSDENKYGISIFVDGENFENVRLRGNIVLADSAPLHQNGIVIAESATGTYADIELTDNLVKGVQSQTFIEQTNQGRLRNNSPPQAQDVRALSSPNEYLVLDHDGSGTNTSGRAQYLSGSWESLVDGTTIS